MPFDIPDNWTWIRLKNLCKLIYSGKSPKYSKDITNNIAIGQAANNGTEINFKLAKYCTDEFVMNMPEYYYLRKYDVLLNTLGHGTLGRCGLYQLDRTDVLTDGHLFVFRLFDEITSVMLYKFLFLNRTNIEKSSNGTTNQIFLSLSTVGDYLFPLPPLNEQKRIVEKINLFEPLILQYEKLETKLSQLEQEFPEKLKKSILQYAIEGKLVKQDPNDEPASALLERIKIEKEKLIKEGKIKRDKNESYIYQGDDKNYYEKNGVNSSKIGVPFEIPNSWCWVKSKMILRRIQYGFNGAGKDNGTYKLLRITDIQNNKVNWCTLPYCEIDIEAADDYQIQKDDIFITRTGGTIGKSFVLNEDKNNVVFAGYLIRFQLIDKQQISYISKFLGSPLYWNQVADKTAGTGQPNINGVSLSNLFIPIPPTLEQKRIIVKLEIINNLLSC